VIYIITKPYCTRNRVGMWLHKYHNNRANSLMKVW